MKDVMKEEMNLMGTCLVQHMIMITSLQVRSHPAKVTFSLPVITGTMKRCIQKHFSIYYVGGVALCEKYARDEGYTRVIAFISTDLTEDLAFRLFDLTPGLIFARMSDEIVSTLIDTWDSIVDEFL